MNQNVNNLLWIGTIVNTHGIKGELRILSDIDNIKERFAIGKNIFTKDSDDNITSFTITSMRLHKNFVLKFDFDCCRK